jgi:putative endonuclease
VTHARRALGASGEELVAIWYESHGFSVVARNWRNSTGELDIVAVRGTLVVFCEVKTRTSDAFGVPAEAITRTKRLRLRRLAAQWLAQAAHHAAEIRFDVASVRNGEIEVIEAAF